MVTAMIIGSSNNRKIYILSNPINTKVTFPEQIRRAKYLNESLGGKYSNKFYVEQVAYQASFDQQLREEGLRSKGISIGSMDKRERLVMVSRYIENGVILFPKHGVSELMNQILNFGVESHDDLLDAFTILIMGIYEDKPFSSGIVTINHNLYVRSKSSPLINVKPGRPSSYQGWDQFIDEETKEEFRKK